jgi:histone H3/H4
MQVETFLLLLINAAGKKAEARKRIFANDKDIDAAMNAAKNI